MDIVTVVGVLVALAALVIQIIVWRTARTDRILLTMLDELRGIRAAVTRPREA